MSTPLPPFLAALGVADADLGNVDERALRRAYARQLKQIDVEAEPQRFQALREALDASLRWLSMRDRAQAAAAAPPPATEPASPAPASFVPRPFSPPITPPTDAEAIGTAVFANFHQDVARVFRDGPGAQAALARALADPRLVNIDARTVFEGHVARLLASGWRPGHDHLLDPAIEAFGWDHEHARLAHYGQVGAMLDAALRDRGTWRGFGNTQRAILERLILVIRDSTPPDPARLSDEVQQLQFLVERVPHWLRIVAPVDPVNARFALWRESPESMRPLPEELSESRMAGRKPASSALPAILVMACIVVLAIFVRLGSREPDGHVGQPPLANPRAVDAAAAAADADLLRRQRQAEALLSNIRTAQPAPSPFDKARAQGPSHALDAPPRPTGGTFDDKPWWAPDWAATPAR